MTEPHPLDVALEHCLRGRFDESETILRSIQSNDARAQFNLGWHACRQGLWHNGAVYLDVGRMLECYGSPPLRNGKPIWNEQPLVGRTVHLRCEGGYGDEIIGARFVRCFSKLGANVVVSCSPALAALFSRIEGVKAVATFQGADYVHCDYWVPAMSCPRWFSPKASPYLTVNHELGPRWRELIDARESRLRIGLRWAGNPKFEGQQFRKFPAELMLGLTKAASGAAFYSLQVGNDLIDELPGDMIDLGPHLTDWDQTAAAICQLDLVITSCTAVAHCAAALGVPTWVVVPVMPYYLWAVPGERSVWYDSVTLFRQTEFGSWSQPFEEIARRLASLAGDERCLLRQVA